MTDDTSTVDLSALVPEDVPAPPGPVPDHRASRDDRRRSIFNRSRRGAESPASQPPRAPRRTPRERNAIPNRKGQFVKPLTNLYTMGGMAFMMRGDGTCGTAVIENAAKCATALDELAYKNEAIRRALWTLTRTSDYGMVLAAHAPILLAIGMHHVAPIRKATENIGANMVQDLVASMRQEEAESTPDTPETPPADPRANRMPLFDGPSGE